ncbi:MAG: reverse gyrase [Desulfurococcales archaeon]|nr:reverse gyrase [Desulfurococcales archaeon]
MSSIEPIMRAMCPNCGGPISASRLADGLPCERCLPTPVYGGPREIGEALRKAGKLSGYAWLYDLELDLEDFQAFFEARTGSRLWSAQTSWAKRLLTLDSLAIIAPTGVGKTTLLMVYAAYRAARHGWKVLYIVPTQNLVRQVYEKLSRMADGVVYYTGSMGRKAKKEALERIESGDFRILIITTSFLQRGFTVLSRASPFQLILVDDVDSLLRSGTNVERVLLLMGFSRDTIEKAEELVKTRFRLYAALQAGKEDKVEELKTKLAELEAELALQHEQPMSQLVIASATGRPRGIKHYLFKELLGFEVGGGSDYMRSVTDTYTISYRPIEETVRIVKKLGSGGIIFVSQLYGKETAKIVAAKLEKEGIRAAIALAGTRRAIDKLARGEVDVVVGVASRYGVIVRGIDLPERIRYAVFVGVPARRMKLSDALSSPRRQLSLLYELRDRGVGEAGEFIVKLSRYLEKIPNPTVLSLAYKGRIEVSGLLEEAVDTMKRAAKLISREIERILQESGGTIRIGGSVIERRGDRTYFVIPDAPTYLQASGRTSRLLRGVMTHGLSVVVSENRDHVSALGERLKWYTQSELTEFESVDLDSVLQKIEASRRGEGKKVNVKTVLLIVESPTKARTIAWFWGRPSKRRIGRVTVYETSVADPSTGAVYLLMVVASRGHVLELAIDEEDSVYGVRVENGVYKPVYTAIKKCLSCGYTFAGDGPCPRCGSTEQYSAQAVIGMLRKLAVEVDEVVIATDPDREGEKIAWDIYLALRPYNPNIRRGRFHEVTRKAVLEALATGETINENLVKAQIVRRIEDRWIGFSLSRHLWSIYGKKWLGAGRVQTPVLGWAVERYEQWKANKGYGTLLRHEDTGERIYVFTADKPEWRPGDRIKARVVEREEWEETVTPPPPFTTDEMLYEASRVLGFSASQTMRLAQDLFESGLITYHRTDSTRVSPTGIAVAREYLEQAGLIDLYQGRSWGEGGAHEAIRPTKPIDAEQLRRGIIEGTIRVQTKLTWAHFRLYDLIFRRFIASQMKPDRLRRVRVTLDLRGVRVEKEAIIGLAGQGYTRILRPRISRLLAEPRSEIDLVVERVARTSSVRLYNAGDLVKIMKREGIGRPSTYAKAIEANRRHGYIILSKKRQYVVPTKLGISVYKYLSEHYRELVSVETSRRMEEMLDRVESGDLEAGRAIEMIASMIAGAVEDVSISRVALGAVGG